MNPIDKAHNLIPKMKDWPPMKDRQTVDVYELCGVAKPTPKAGTDPDGPSGTQEFADRPDAYVDQDTD